MAILPKMTYNNKAIKDITYCNTILHDIYIDGVIKYHKHRGDPKTKGGCYQKPVRHEKPTTKTYIWNRGNVVDRYTFNGEYVEGEGTTTASFDVYEYTCVQNGAKTRVEYCTSASGARDNMAHGWGLSSSYGNASGKDESGSPPATIKTSATTTEVYYTYSLTCGYDEK